MGRRDFFIWTSVKSILPQHFISRNNSPRTEMAFTRGEKKGTQTNPPNNSPIKVANREVKIDACDKLIPPDRLSRHTNAHSYQIPSCKTSIRKESFYSKTIRDWNNQWPMFLFAPVERYA